MTHYRVTYASKKEGENYQFSELMWETSIENALREARAKARKNHWTLVSVHEEEPQPIPRLVYPPENPDRWPYREFRPPMVLRG
jgi:hypothetical protein